MLPMRSGGPRDISRRNVGARVCGASRHLFRLLDRFDAAHDAFDPKVVQRVVGIEPPKDRPPHRHVLRAVRGRQRIAVPCDERFRPVSRERAAMPRSDHRQVRRPDVQRRHHRTTALPIATVARCAVEREEIRAVHRRDHERRVRSASGLGRRPRIEESVDEDHDAHRESRVPSRAPSASSAACSMTSIRDRA